MTLILTVTNPDFTVQVSDRLLTVEGETWDALANKTLVFRGRDGLVVLSYTGRAHLVGQSTDHWIAERLLDQPVGVRGFGGGPRKLPDVGLAMRRLAEAATRSRQWGQHNGALAAGGFLWPVKRQLQRLRPVLWQIDQAVPGQYEARQYMPRHEARQGHLSIPSGTSVGIPKVMARLKAASAGDHDSVERLLVELVREAADGSPVIGPDCMSVVLSRRLGVVRIRFVPLEEHRMVVTVGMREPVTADLPTVFSPWIIAPGHLVPPTTISGSGMVMNLGGLRVDIEAPHSADRFLMSTQDRPAAPGYTRSRWQRPAPPEPPAEH